MAYNRPFLDLLADAGIVINHGKLGPEAQPSRPGYGATLWVNPSAPGRKHRVMARCYTCGKELSAGRLAQHQKIHKEVKY